MAPGGWIARLDPDGRELELFSIGFRNQYDIAFSPDGELFTYDADMEWDIGTPWYRPTRVCHVTSGSEFGWRSGDAKWPVWYPDSLPPVLDIGPGSPTGIVFGTGAAYPEKYRRALFIADWSFGFIYAIHLTENGASYTAEKEVFCGAPALQVTDMTVHSDGHLYFAIGGRQTPSALYRIRARDDVPESGANDDGGDSESPVNETMQLRRQLEEFHLTGCGESLDEVWPHLAHNDRFVRYAARIALERTPPIQWQERAMAETDPQRVLELLIALARALPKAAALERVLPQFIAQRLEWSSLDESQRLHLLRAAGLLLTRHGPVSEATRQWLNGYFAPHYPGDSETVNIELARLLVVTGAPDYVETTLGLLDKARTQEAQIHYVMCLRLAADGWSPESRQTYLEWFHESAAFQGGASFAGYLRQARQEFIDTLPPPERQRLASLIAPPATDQDPYAVLKAREVVQDWTVGDLLPAVQQADWDSRDLENGREVFETAQCFKCHQFAGSGGITGPDLTALSRRYTIEYLLETIIDPDKEISDQYQASVFELDDGRIIVGRVANLSGNNLLVQTDMIAPGKLTTVDRNTIVDSRPSTVSPMPADLLNTFSREDILDLMALLRSAESHSD
jgi:putative heme-binding domain-containing protein